MHWRRTVVGLGNLKHIPAADCHDESSREMNIVSVDTDLLFSNNMKDETYLDDDADDNDWDT